jgi:3-hydroxyacyl-CoA dehydrogenase
VSELVSLRSDGNVAVITIDNPPVNALNHAVRAGLVDAVSRARADAGTAAIVIVCAGRTFIAGADIGEFGKPAREPTTIDVIAAIETSEKPVIAAMHGTPLGGGLEVALGCHCRVAAPGTRLGLPEIKLGLIPGPSGCRASSASTRRWP